MKNQNDLLSDCKCDTRFLQILIFNVVNVVFTLGFLIGQLDLVQFQVLIESL